MQEDSDLLKRFPFIKYFDPNSPPLDIANNTAPVVDAGVDQTIMLPNKAVLLGTVNDDGLPLGWKPTSLWSIDLTTLLTKPLIIKNPLLPITEVTFTQPGSYTFTLSATDLLKTSSDTVVVNVLPSQNLSLQIQPGQLTTLPNGIPVGLSTLLFNQFGPIFSGVSYDWGISSTNSVGTLTQINGNIASFLPLHIGNGMIFVNAHYAGTTLTKAMPVNVLSSLPIASATPSPSPSASPLPNPTISNVLLTSNICLSNTCTLTTITINGTNFNNGISVEASGTGLATKSGTIISLNNTQMVVSFVGLSKSKNYYDVKVYYADGRQSIKSGAFKTN
jgi:hypothetical protein